MPPGGGGVSGTDFQLLMLSPNLLKTKFSVLSIKLRFRFRSQPLFQLLYTARNRIHGVQFVFLLGLDEASASGKRTLLGTEFMV